MITRKTSQHLKRGPTLGKLATGKRQLEVKSATPAAMEKK